MRRRRRTINKAQRSANPPTTPITAPTIGPVLGLCVVGAELVLVLDRILVETSGMTRVMVPSTGEIVGISLVNGTVGFREKSTHDPVLLTVPEASSA